MVDEGGDKVSDRKSSERSEDKYPAPPVWAVWESEEAWSRRVEEWKKGVLSWGRAKRHG